VGEMKNNLFIVIFLFMALGFGCLSGWFVRARYTEDRYINSLAARHEATATYFNTKMDTMIQDNERIYKNGK
jgi:hypothetical protein